MSYLNYPAISNSTTYVEKRTSPVAADYEYSGITTKSASFDKSYQFQGEEDALREQQDLLLAEGKWPLGEGLPGTIVSCELRREKGYWTLSVTQSEVVGRDQNFDSGLAKDAGKSRTNPLYRWELSTEAEGILNLSSFDKATNEQLSAFKKLIEGANLTDKFQTLAGNVSSLGKYFSDSDLEETANFVMRQSQYYKVGALLKMSYKIAGDSVLPPVGGVATILDPPNAALKLPDPLKWLFMGAVPEEQDDGNTWITETYLSGEWSKIYPSDPS